ncbi:Non-histone chromosomal protein 6 [Dimargaris cristalligena]|uniref:Non-histone chromosomal protein 6 n=1 Tax=Dimargaris cristalligena TaxID=215637 RepID=A0A4V1J482_9FUNG|nr:Non-histone chromosomal protein 6 [Dimargaris cristalligena]RKP34649.1 Non-histone chromosomal protein 6 [Dimargaris cristalligena]|eukprot:RKP34649.1 Non-histone chromosomal protein 6 [Dimargaris cristalligena]
MPKAATTKRTTKGAGVEKKKRRGKKDPNAPKRSLSAYMFFAQSNRENIKRDNPDATFGQIGKMMGAQWKSMTDTDKIPYEDQARADKERYEEEKAAYAANGPDASSEED